MFVSGKVPDNEGKELQPTNQPLLGNSANKSLDLRKGNNPLELDLLSSSGVVLLKSSNC